MSAEWFTAVATASTFVVIAASAVAALVQLRHMQGSNQIAGLTEFRETLESAEFTLIMDFALSEVPARLADPDARKGLLASDWTAVPPEFRPLSKIANVFENMGVLVKNGILHREVVCDMWSHVVIRSWNALGPIVHNRRLLLRNPALNENFEYLAALSARWVERHPRGAYPATTVRMPQTGIWPELQQELVDRER